MFLGVSAFLISMWKMVWQRISHQHQRDQQSEMFFIPGPVVAKFHTHPWVNKEATLAVVGYIPVSLPASLVQMYLHRAHTTHHLLRKQTAKLAAEPWGTYIKFYDFFLKNHRISRFWCQCIEDVMFFCRSADAVWLWRPPDTLQTYTISQLLHFLWKDCVNRKAHYTKVSELRLYQKRGRHFSLFIYSQRNHAVPHTCTTLSDSLENVSHRILPRPPLHHSYNIN